MGLLLTFDPNAPTPSPEHLLSYLCSTSQLIHGRHLLMLLLFISIPSISSYVRNKRGIRSLTCQILREGFMISILFMRRMRFWEVERLAHDSHPGLFDSKPFQYMQGESQHPLLAPYISYPHPIPFLVFSLHTLFWKQCWQQLAVLLCFYSGGTHLAGFITEW